MMLQIQRIGGEINVAAVWTTRFGAHSNSEQIMADLARPANAAVRTALGVVLDWADNTEEPALRTAIENYNSRAGIDTEIARLQQRRSELP